MKTRNIVIAILSVALIIFATLYLTDRDELSPAESEINEIRQPDFTKRELLRLCTLQPRYDDGRSIDSLEAREGIRDFEGTFRNEIMAYHICLDSIKEMISQVEEFNLEVRRYNNSQPQVKLDSVIGFRFYHSKTKKRSYQGTGELKRKKDLVAVGTLSNGNDIFHVYDIREDNENNAKKVIEIRNQLGMNVFSYFRPCPRICGSEELEELIVE